VLVAENADVRPGQLLVRIANRHRRAGYQTGRQQACIQPPA
jgi:multidrug efflux pump subunit AcrA (membrane-fusion protein)